MSSHQSVTGTLTTRGQASNAFYLRPGEVVAVTLTITGTATISLSELLGVPSSPQAYRPRVQWSSNQTATQWRNDGTEPVWLALVATAISGSVAFTLADVAGDQILQEWRAADGTLVFRITDEGPTDLPLNVKAFGAVGDGVADDTAAIQAAVTAAAGKALLIPPATYAISSAITVSSATHILGYGATLLQTAAATSGIVVSASDVTIEGLRIRGTQYASINTSEYAILVTAASWAAKLNRVAIRACRMDRWGYEGIRLKWVTNFAVESCTIEQVYYTGIAVLSGTDGRIANNFIEDIPGTPNAYGITLTRDEQDSLATDPRTSRVSVVGNVVRDVPVWNGIDSHGGEDITIAGNVVEGCDKPIWVVSSDATGNVETWGPKRITIVGNTVQSGVSDGSADVGIVVAGAGTGVGAVVDYAEDITIANNVIVGCGDETSSISGGIQIEMAKSVTVVGNTIVEPSPNAITCRFDVLGLVVSGNVARDMWSDTHLSRFLRIENDSVTASVTGNSVVDGVKTATNINSEGVTVISGAASVSLALGVNNWLGMTTANTVRDQVGGSILGVRSVSTTPYTVVASDATLLVDATTAGVTVNLPPVAGSSGRRLTVKKIDASGNAVTLDGNSSETIDGATTYPLAAQWDAVTVECNGTAWFALGIGP